eukprot:COSAG06_NODE_64235_length_260_cov_0.633540_1_plen_60_part_01
MSIDELGAAAAGTTSDETTSTGGAATAGGGGGSGSATRQDKTRQGAKGREVKVREGVVAD